MSIPAGPLFLLLCLYLASRRSGGLRTDAFGVSHADDREIERHIRDLDRHDRRAALLAPWRAPWPWWFLGACLAFAGLCLVAGASQWGKPDALILLVGGALFLLASAFKAWTQEQAAPVPLRVRLAQQWRRVTRA